jgi:hypothetical protein
LVEKFKGFLCAQGIRIMLAGFTLSAIGIIFYIKTQHGNQELRKIAFATTVAGIAVYLAGRIGVLLDRRAQRMRRERRVLESEDEAS